MFDCCCSRHHHHRLALALNPQEKHSEISHILKICMCVQNVPKESTLNVSTSILVISMDCFCASSIPKSMVSLFLFLFLSCRTCVRCIPTRRHLNGKRNLEKKQQNMHGNWKWQTFPDGIFGTDSCGPGQYCIGHPCCTHKNYHRIWRVGKNPAKLGHNWMQKQIAKMISTTKNGRTLQPSQLCTWKFDRFNEKIFLGQKTNKQTP